VTFSEFLPLLPFIVIVAAVSLVGAKFRPGIWYAELDKAPWTPPDWLFAPVWAVLYLGIAIAGWLVWRNSEGVHAALVLWCLQLIANALWSWLFFGRHDVAFALVDIVLLLLLLLAFIAISAPISRLAAWIFVPYAVWVTYATTLNVYAWLRNPRRNGV
jgi:tryptophan-rich sensory protein